MRKINPEDIPAFVEEEAANGCNITGFSGVVAWSRDADPAVGEYGPPVIIYQRGKIEELE